LTLSRGKGAKPSDQPSRMKISIGPESGKGSGDRSPKPECCDLSKNGRSTVELDEVLICLTEPKTDARRGVSCVPGGPLPCSSALSGQCCATFFNPVYGR
jgi:hypothetical protein